MAEAFLTPLSLLATIVKTAPDALVVVDASGRIMFANEQTELTMGYPREDLIGEPFARLLPEGEEPPDVSQSSGEVAVRHVVRENGELRPVEIRTNSVPFEGGTLMAHSIRDVSGRERAERETRKLQAQLAHVGRVSALGELVTSVAHEINQPLAAILSNAQAAQRFMQRPDPDLDEVAAALEDIIQQNRRASAVISHLRSMVRREMPQPERVDLASLVMEMERLLRKHAQERQIELRLGVSSAIPSLEGDPIQLQQVLLILVLNAFDALGRVERSPRRVGVTVRPEGENELLLEVRDNGPGVPADERDRIFEAFVSTKEDGLGMGLSIAKTVVELHGGRIVCTDNESGGATFRVVLPRVS